MRATFERRSASVLLVLSTITVISWWIGGRHGSGAPGINAPVTVAVMAIAALKVRIIIMEFMEARYAPRLLRGLTDAWLALLLATLLAIYLWS